MKKRRLRRSFVGIFGVVLVAGGFFAYKHMHFGPPPVWAKKGYKPVMAQPTLSTSYDTVVLAGGAPGVSAAVSAAHNGLKTLLVVRHAVLGGTMTVGALNSIDMNYGPPGHTLLTQGLFSKFFSLIGNHTSFDVHRAEWALAKMVHTKNLSVAMQTSIVGVHKKGGTVTSVELLHNGKKTWVHAKNFIDASGNASLAAAAGAKYTIGRQGTGMGKLMQAPTLVFKLSGVNWNQVHGYLQNGHSPVDGATATSAWGYGKVDSKYKPLNPNIRFRGMNLGRQADGTVLVNAVWIFGVNGLSQSSMQKGIAEAKKEIPRIVSFLRKNAPGFSHAKLLGYAKELYVRETRHIIGEHILNVKDLLTNADPWDTIAIGSYPVDIQAADAKEYGDALFKPIQYGVPFRSLVPVGLNNLLVINRSASYSSMAAGSARVLPVGMAEGQAAGVAAAYAMAHHLSFPALSQSHPGITAIQSTLKHQGAYLPHFSVINPYTKRWAFPYLVTMLDHMMATGGYTNKFGLRTPITAGQLSLILHDAPRLLPSAKRSLVKAVAAKPSFNASLNGRTGTAMILAAAGIHSSHPLTTASKMGIIPTAAKTHIVASKPFLREDAYAELVGLRNYLKTH